MANCINGVKRQIEIITPILATLTVLTGGTSSAAIYQPSAIFLSGGAVEIVSCFIFPATVGVVVLNFMSRTGRKATRIKPLLLSAGLSHPLFSIL